MFARKTTTTGKVVANLIVCVVVCALLAPPFFLAATPKKAYAQASIIACVSAGLAAMGIDWLEGTGEAVGAGAATAAPSAALAPLSVPVTVVADPANLGFQADQTISANITRNNTTVSAGNETSLTFKECVTDPLMWFLKETIISELTAAMVDWINSGFEGGPMFLSDPELFFQDVADQIAGEFITEGGLEFMCSPFQLDLQIALITKYFTSDKERSLSCRFSDVVTNIEGFLAGTFEDGGWPGWFEMVATPQNNKFGSLFKADAAVNARISSRTGSLNMDLDWGKGFLSPKCDDDGDPETAKKSCTPGTWVEHQLIKHTDVGLEELHLADELDEIVGALLSQLVQQVMTGAQGLLGLSAETPDSSSYTSQLREYAQSGSAPTVTAYEEEVEDVRAGLLARVAALRASENAIPRDTFLIYIDEIERRINAVDLTNAVNALGELAEIEDDLNDLEENIRAGVVPAPSYSPAVPPVPTSKP